MWCCAVCLPLPAFCLVNILVWAHTVDRLERNTANGTTADRTKCRAQRNNAICHIDVAIICIIREWIRSDKVLNRRWGGEHSSLLFVFLFVYLSFCFCFNRAHECFFTLRLKIMKICKVCCCRFVWLLNCEINFLKSVAGWILCLGWLIKEEGADGRKRRPSLLVIESCLAILCLRKYFPELG